MKDHEPSWIATACGFAVLLLLLLGEAYAVGAGSSPADGGAAARAPSGGVMAARFHISR